jgi:hypothetical protein
VVQDQKKEKETMKKMKEAMEEGERIRKDRNPYSFRQKAKAVPIHPTEALGGEEV